MCGGGIGSNNEENKNTHFSFSDGNIYYKNLLIVWLAILPQFFFKPRPKRYWMLWNREGGWIDILSGQSVGGVPECRPMARPVRRAPRGEREQNFAVENPVSKRNDRAHRATERDKLRKDHQALWRFLGNTIDDDWIEISKVLEKTTMRVCVLSNFC